MRYWLGAPQRVERVARFEGEVWTYRFLQLSDPRFAYLHIDPSGTVQRVLFVDDVSNAPTTAHDGGAAPHSGAPCSTSPRGPLPG